MRSKTGKRKELFIIVVKYPNETIMFKFPTMNKRREFEKICDEYGFSYATSQCIKD